MGDGFGGEAAADDGHHGGVEGETVAAAAWEVLGVVHAAAVVFDGDLEAFCAELQDKGVTFPVPLKHGVNGKLLCYVAAPDNVSIELMET